MPHSSGFLRQLAAVAAAALALGSCQRAEYAVLPQTSPYHATYHAPVPAAPAVAAASALPPAPPAPTPLSAPSASATRPAVAARPAKVPTPAPKQGKLLHKLLAHKVTKKADKLVASMLKHPHNAAEVNRISGYLRTGLLLVLIGLLITILPGSTFELVGTIVAIIGVVFLVIWLLDVL